MVKRVILLKLNVAQPNRQHEVVPQPEKHDLNQGWNDDWVQLDSIPVVVVVVYEHLDALVCEEFVIITHCQSLDECSAFLVLLVELRQVDSLESGWMTGTTIIE